MMCFIKQQWIKLTILILSVYLSGCALTNQREARAWLKPGVQISLPAPTVTPEIHEQQLLTADYKGKKQSLLVMLDADNTHLELVGLSSVGIKLFQIRYDQTGIYTQKFISMPQLPAASQVLADIMFSYWSPEAWRHVLPKGWHINNAALRREITDDKGQTVICIQYEETPSGTRPVLLHHSIFDYQIHIQTLD